MYFCNFLEELEALRAFIDMETSSFIPKGPLKTLFRETLTPVINTTNFSETGKSTPSTCVLFLKCIFIYFTSVPQLFKLVLQPRYWIRRKAFHFPHQERF